MRCLLTLICGTVLAACGSDAASESDAGEAGTEEVAEFMGSERLEAGEHQLVMDVNGSRRLYTMQIPRAVDGEDIARPLLINMHGYTSNMTQQMGYMVGDRVAFEAGYVVIFPDGLSNSWNAATCCGASQASDVDDVGFIRAMVAHAQDRTWIDPKRIYATGMSNGGMMSHRLGCEASDLFAAIAPVAGASTPGAGGACNTDRAMPVMHFHGRADSVAPYVTAPAAIGTWRSLNNCEGAAVETYNSGDTVCETYNSCRDGVEVTLCSSEGADHCWPGIPFCISGSAATGISANAAMVEFFDRFRLP